jgi:preprotein translocase subunit YajC
MMAEATKAPEQAAPAAGASEGAEPKVSAPAGEPKPAPKSGEGRPETVQPAPGTGGGQNGGQTNSFMSPLLMMGAVMVLFYFMLMHPQRKREKARQAMLKNLKTGDRVVTASGVVAEIAELDESDAVLKIDPRKDVRMRVRRAFIAGPAGDAASEDAAKESGNRAG